MERLEGHACVHKPCDSESHRGQESKPAGESSCGYDDDMYTVDDTDVIHLLPI